MALNFNSKIPEMQTLIPISKSQKLRKISRIYEFHSHFHYSTKIGVLIFVFMEIFWVF